jgi:DNA-binding response OmpR family regulator
MWPGTSESGRSLLRESGGEKLSLERGDLSIDLGGGEVRVRGQELQLSAEEFDLLLFLIGHPTSIITPRLV